MTLLPNFTTPLWEMLSGQLLLFTCSLFYLAWWIADFRPGSSGSAAGGFYLMAALVTGLAAIFLLSAGINRLAADSQGFPVKFILLGAAALFVVLLPVTAIGWGRMVTSELLIIHIWAALEMSTVAVLRGTGGLGPGSAAALAVLIGVGFAASMVCYVLYYRLGPEAGYWDGMIPLLTSALVAAVISGALVLSRNG